MALHHDRWYQCPPPHFNVVDIIFLWLLYIITNHQSWMILLIVEWYQISLFSSSFLISWPTFNDMDDPLLIDGGFQISLFLSSDIFFVLSWPNIKDTVDLPLNRWLLLHFSIFIFFVLWYDQPSMICSRHIKHSDPDDVSFVSLFLLPAIRKLYTHHSIHIHTYISLTFYSVSKNIFWSTASMLVFRCAISGKYGIAVRLFSQNTLHIKVLFTIY